MDDVKYTQYYVAFLDILGFKNLVNDPNRTCEEIVRIYDFVQYRYETFFKSEIEIQNNIKMKVMSDSICLYIKTDFPNALHYLISYCVTFQCDLFANGHLLRGGITSGDMYVENDIIFGPALTEAYLLEEKNAKVPRIIIRKKTMDEGIVGMDEDALKITKHIIFRDNDAFYTLNYFWLLALRQDKNDDLLKEVKDTIANQLDTTIDDSIRQKYLYIEKNLNRYLRG